MGELLGICGSEFDIVQEFNNKHFTAFYFAEMDKMNIKNMNFLLYFINSVKIANYTKERRFF